jgi:hypothetical protein
MNMGPNKDEIFEDAAEDYEPPVPSQLGDPGSHNKNRRRNGESPLFEDNNNNINNNSINNNHTLSMNRHVIFDEKKFFCASSIPVHVLEKAKSMIYERIEEPLRRLETDDGPNLYLQYCRERNRKMEVDSEEEQRVHRQNLDDLLVRGDPREYQRQLLQVALEKNTIINLGTGAGKTLIALMCIKEIRAADKDKKQTLFLVPSVALAIQHGFTLQSNLPNFKIETAYYARSGSQNTRASLVDCDVIVATHGVVSILLCNNNYVGLRHGNIFRSESR